MFTKIIHTLFLATLATAYNDGLTGSLKMTVIEQAKDAYFAEILKLINNMPIPDIDIPWHGYLKNNYLNIEENAYDVIFSVDTKNNAMVLTCSNLGITFTSEKFKYRELLIWTTGSVTVNMNTVKIQAGFGQTTQTLADGRIVPAFTAEDVKVEIDRSDIDIHIHGSIIGDIVNLFTWFFKGIVANEIEDNIKLALETTAPAIGSALMAATDGYLYVPYIGDLSNLVLDWETPQPNLITATAF
mmetsp:Transcript_55057/g.75654  ORF Transcript_55057/g.75654 Transcript_55057/m.75654 type:complete len:243 (+) Transcript_55057:28-756(+)